MIDPGKKRSRSDTLDIVANVRRPVGQKSELLHSFHPARKVPTVETSREIKRFASEGKVPVAEKLSKMAGRRLKPEKGRPAN